MKKRILGLIVSALLIMTLTGCGNDNQNNLEGGNNPDSNVSNNEKPKGKCTAIECIKKIEPENTVDEINTIIGITGELTNEQYNEYYWEISETTGITVTYYSGVKGTIKVEAERDSFKNSKVDLSQMETMKAKINDGITYDQIKAYVGNVDGVLTEKSSSTLKYTWVNSNGGYLNANFSVSSGQCTMFFGVDR